MLQCEGPTPVDQAIGHDVTTRSTTMPANAARLLIQRWGRSAMLLTGAGPTHRQATTLSAATLWKAEPHSDLSRSSQQPANSPNLLEVLSAGLFPVPAEYPLLQPLWAAEAMHRAVAMRGLIVQHEARQGGEIPSPLCQNLELALAQNLAMLLTSLKISTQPRYIPCTDTVYGVVAGLLGLFSPSAGGTLTANDMAPLRLRSDRRRALVLAVADFVIGLLLAHEGCDLPLHITLALTKTTGKEYILLVEGDGIRADMSADRDSIEVIQDMTCVLDGDFKLHAVRRRQWRAELQFREV
jgi:hypothetical protein